MATPREQAAMQKTIRIRGTVSLVGGGIASSQPPERRAENSFCIEDASVGIWVRSGQALRAGLLTDSSGVLGKLAPGVDLEIIGILDKGAFAPVVLPMQITILGKSDLPDAPRAELRRFLNGANDLRRVKVNGVVHTIASEVDWWALRIETGVGHFLTRLPMEEQYSPDRLLDAEVEVTGLAAVSRNWRSQFVCPRVIISHKDDFRIRKPAPADPFAAKKVPLAELDGYSADGRPQHRRRIEGTVTYYDGKYSLYVQDADIGIQVQITERSKVEVGDRVEVSGFIDTTGYLAGLQGASVRPVGRHVELLPVKTTIAKIVQEHEAITSGRPVATKSRDGQLVTVSGRLLDFQRGAATKPSRLEIDCGDAVTTAFLSGSIGNLLPGTELEVTGVAKLTFSAPIATANLAQVDRVDLQLRDASDIVVLSNPSWWTPPRTFAALLIVAGFALSAFAWAFTLQRTLAQKSSQLAREMRNRHDAALEFQGAIRERTRLAANLHDTLLQTMTGIAYQIEACEQSERQSIRGQLETASKMVQHGRDDLRNTVWALHCLPLAEGTFVESVQQLTRKFGLTHDTMISVNSDANFPSLADFIAGNLLLVIQEAIHNAIKHSEAKCIDIELGVGLSGQSVAVLVRDDGCGFDVKSRRKSTDGHFGIESMEQRVERLGGKLTIESQLTVGTLIRAEIPLREFDPKIA